MEPAFRVRIAVFASGEHFPVLLDKHGCPLFRPTVFALTQVRGRSLSTNTSMMEASMNDQIAIPVTIASVSHKGKLKDLDEIYADTWIRRDMNLGDQKYCDYLSSEHWKKVKAKAKSRPNYQKCEFCNSLEVELHHTSYKWILTKNELRAIISLCRDHHQEVHDLARSRGISVRIATNSLRRKYQIDCRTPNRIPSCD
ncbi:hypothetical protein [Xanthomonas sacchari]|uniref:hypothetical protein n=1 Tax=Xanthomonas sacchari TaxID=56458 RepID=UPI0022572BC8|nr:hypothetical protein [Xanthomonas sacchari]